MGIFDTMRNIFAKTEVTEESFEYESIDSYLSKLQAQEGEDPSDNVAVLCDQIVDASYQMEDLRSEYDLVTSYFTDIQTIEELPSSVRKEIIVIAKKITMLEGETTEYLRSDDRISDENFRMIQSLEKNLSQILGQLNELETMDMKIKRDMKHLEGEKGAQEYAQEYIENQQGRIRRFLAYFGIFAALMVLTLAIIGVTTQTNLLLPILLIMLVVALAAAAAVMGYRKLSYDYKVSELKLNKAINLMNKVKIKYINNTATLDYLYGKYGVKSLREMEYLYDQYLIMVDEVRRFQKSSGELRECSDELSKLLFSYGVKDPDIWRTQCAALIDSREMVEVKHSLNVRRQKLREQIAYNEDLRLAGLKNIKEILKVNPELREQVKRELDTYHIHVM